MVYTHLEGMIVRGRRQSVFPTPLVPSRGLVTKEDSALPLSMAAVLSEAWDREAGYVAPPSVQ